MANILAGIVSINTRSFGTISGLMHIEERGTDRMTITHHPVQDSAEVTDHAFMEPAELILRMMAVNSILSGQIDGRTYVSNMYQKVRDLQKTRETFSIQTGKRLYQNMLAVSVEVVTDEKTENVLMLSVQCREILKVAVTVVPVPPSLVQAQPQKTGPLNSTGSKQTQATTTAVPYTPPT